MKSRSRLTFSRLTFSRLTLLSGFTLLEVMLALVIIASGLVLLSTTWSSSFARLKKTKTQFEVAALLQRKMTEVELEYSGKPIAEIPEEKADDFGKEYPNYRWKMVSKEFVMPDMSGVLNQDDAGVDPMTQMLIEKLKDYLGKTVKEVKVSVFLKDPNKKKELEYDASTFFVDYDKELNLGLPGQ
jgi:general secretion pathway protein I